MRRRVLNGRSSLNEFDLSELAYLGNEAGNTALALYMTAISGYLIIAYVVGAALNRYQIVLINSLFLFFSGAFTYSAFVSFQGMRYYSEESAKIRGDPAGLSSTAEDAFVATIVVSLILGMIGAIAFMWDIRSRHGRDA
jgi:hypothetical protein